MVVKREGVRVHWLAFFVFFAIFLLVSTGGMALGNVMTGLAPLDVPLWEWTMMVILSAAMGIVLAFGIFIDKISLSPEGITFFGVRRAKNYKWSDFSGLRPTLAFGDVVLTYGRGGHDGQAVSRGMTKAILDHPCRPKDWSLPPPILEYINTGKVPIGVSWSGGWPTAQETKIDQATPFWKEQVKARSYGKIGLVYGLLGLILAIVILLVIH